MSLAPRFLVNLWTGFKVARFARHQETLARDGSAQEKVFAERMAALKGTEYASLHDLKPGITYARFQAKVPVRGYEWFELFIRRMAGGESDILVPGRCSLFVETAGTMATAPKLLPVPEAMLAHFRQAGRDALYLYARRAGRPHGITGPYVQAGASTAREGGPESSRTTLDGLLALSVFAPAGASLRAMPPDIASLPEGPAKVDATARAMLRHKVSLVAGTPASVCSLSLAVRDAAAAAGQSPPHLQAVWPQLECFFQTGASLGLCGETLRSALGPSVKLHEVYAAAEGIFAAQDKDSPTALRVLTDTGIFFEFLPVAAYDEAAVAKAGPQCVRLAEVQAGVDYVPVITTPAGLVRYATGDVVRFVSTTPPRLQFVGCAALQLNAVGERVGERDVLETLLAVCAQNGWQATAFHVAPYEQRIGPGQVARAHEWWLELNTHTDKTPTANVLDPALEAELARRHPGYAAKRANLQLDAPLIRLVMPGVFESWAAKHQKAAGVSKLPAAAPTAPSPTSSRPSRPSTRRRPRRSSRGIGPRSAQCAQLSVVSSWLLGPAENFRR